jgi:hypothetical protein
LNSADEEIRKYGYRIPVIYQTKPATKVEATVTTADGKSHTVYVPK